MVGTIEDALSDREGQIDFARAQAELAEAVARLAVLNKLSKRKRS